MRALPSTIALVLLFAFAVYCKSEPQPEVGHWVIYDEERHQFCVYIRVATQLNITYETNAFKPKRIVYNVPGNTHTQLINGDCGTSGKQKIKVSWKSPFKTFGYDTFEFTFLYNERKQEYSVTEVAYAINLPDARRTDLKYYRHQTPIYTTPLHKSYQCADLPPLNLIATDADIDWIDGISLDFLRFQAFYDGDTIQFLEASDCGANPIEPIEPPTQDHWYNMFLDMVGKFISNTTEVYLQMKQLKTPEDNNAAEYSSRLANQF